MEDGREFALPSGAKLFVSVAPFAAAKELQDAFLREVRGAGLGALDVATLQKSVAGALATRLKDGPTPEDAVDDRVLNDMVDRALSLAASKPIEDAVFKCAETAIYRPGGRIEASIPVTPVLFDLTAHREAARADFYEICLAVAEVNLLPFVKALFSMYVARVARSAVTPTSSSQQGPASQTS